ncbi:unnamed protein product [Effrenium voratum]|nr:unnamed protein product [Effrenium voratum]
MSGRTPTSFFAEIDRYEIVEETVDQENPLAKGLAVLKARVPLLGEGTHIEFNIRVQSDGKYHSVRKRFSDFVTLHDFLKARFGPVLSLELPKKTPIRYFNDDKLEDRKNALNAYLRDLCHRAEVVDLVEVRRFFGSQEGAGLRPAAQSASASRDSAPVVLGAAPGKPVAQTESDDELARWDS